MRKYFDADGNPVGDTGRPAASSKGCQGRLAGCFMIVLALLIFGTLVAALVHH